MNYKNLLIIASMLLCSVFATAQTPHSVSRLGQSEGLGNVSVSCLAQDKRGFVWMGTTTAAYCFDGFQFHELALPSDSITRLHAPTTIESIAVAPDSTVWLCSYGAIYRHDPIRGTTSIVRFKGVKDVIASGRILFDHDGRMWLSSRNCGLQSIDTKKGKVKTYDSTSNTAMTLTRSGVMWTVNDRGLLKRYNAASDKFIDYKIPQEVGFVGIFSIIETHDGNIVLLANQGGARMFCPATREWTTLFTTNAEGHDIFIHNAVSNNGQDIWIGTEQGVMHYRIGEGFLEHLSKSYSNTSSLNDNAVHALLLDREQNLWVGTYFGGLNYVNMSKHTFSTINPVDAKGLQAANIIRAFATDGQGRLWVGCEDGGLFINENGSELVRSILTYGGHPLSTNIQSLLRVDDNTMLVGTYDAGVFVVNTLTMAVTDHIWSADGHSGIINDAISRMHLLPNGDILLGSFYGLMLYKPETYTIEYIKNATGFIIHDLCQDQQGNLWIATKGVGLRKLEKNKRGEWEGKDTPFEISQTTCVAVDHRGLLMVGTDGHGLYEYDTRKHTAKLLKLTEEGSDALSVCHIVEDAYGRLWISTHSGLFCYDTASGQCRSYSTSSGLPSNHFNYTAGYTTPSGQLLLGTYNGIACFRPDDFVASDKRNEVYIFDTHINGNEAHFCFASPVFEQTGIVWYRYRLVGASNEWTICQEPQTIELSHLAAGKYRLEVQASSYPNKWDDASTATYTFTVAPPWWASWWAYTLYFLLAIAATGIVVRRMWKRTQREHKEELERKENEKLSETLQSKIAFFTSITHEIRTPLTLIIGGLERLATQMKGHAQAQASLDVTNRNAQRLLALVNQLLDFRKIESQRLLMNFVNIDLVDIVRHIIEDFQPMEEKRHIALEVSLPDNPVVVMADKESLTKMITNQIVNAMKFCDHTVKVSIAIKRHKENDMVQLRVENDGPRIANNKVDDIFRPFEQYQAPDSKATIKGSGLGLPLTRSLAEMHGGRYFFDTQEETLNAFVLELPWFGNSIENEDKGINKDENKNGGEDGIINEGEYVAFVERNEDEEDSKRTILLVDDEEDMRQYIAEELSSHYNVLEANNGEEALKMLEGNNVALIITDLMMPVMDGNALCEHIRSDIRISHIPIIVLTAKVSLQDHLNALRSQADAYIEKPFSSEHLQAQISNLIHNRELMRHSFIKSPYALVSDISTSKSEDEFLTRLDNYIRQHLEDPQLSVDNLADHMAMSNSTLYRKVKAVTTLSPLDYIRLCRLKQAAVWLREDNMAIKDVAKRLNFSSTSYFTSSFMKQFGITPGEFKKMKN